MHLIDWPLSKWSWNWLTIWDSLRLSIWLGCKNQLRKSIMNIFKQRKYISLMECLDRNRFEFSVTTRTYHAIKYDQVEVISNERSVINMRDVMICTGVWIKFYIVSRNRFSSGCSRDKIELYALFNKSTKKYKVLIHNKLLYLVKKRYMFVVLSSVGPELSRISVADIEWTVLCRWWWVVLHRGSSFKTL